MPPALASAQVKAGKLRAIGITASMRSTLVPELPSLSEAGVKDFNLEIWNAVAGVEAVEICELGQMPSLPAIYRKHKPFGKCENTLPLLKPKKGPT